METQHTFNNLVEDMIKNEIKENSFYPLTESVLEDSDLNAALRLLNPKK